MRRPWWHRLWVLQEIGHGTTGIVHCGELTIDWLELTTFASFLLVANSYRSEEDSSDVYQRALDLNLRVFASRDARSVWAYYNHGSHHKSLDLVDVLRLCADFECAEDLDRIFGLLDLLPDDFAIAPDYALSPALVYEKAAMEAVRIEGDLSILANGGLYAGKDTRIATWAPDLRNLYGLEEREFVYDELRPIASTGATISADVSTVHRPRHPAKSCMALLCCVTLLAPTDIIKRRQLCVERTHSASHCAYPQSEQSPRPTLADGNDLDGY